ncbi:MAG: DUF3800 domain-containing protein [Rickettsiales bacterium]
MNKILFLDESGDHNLTIIDQQHPIFVLGGIVVDKDYALGEMTEKLNAFKSELFGTTDIILHTADFTRQRNGFEKMKDPDFCNLFYKKINNLISGLNLTILACAIKKEQHMARYGFDAVDPYLLSLNVLVERFGFMIGGNKKGQIVAEARDPTLDRQLDLAWLNLKVSGTYYMPAAEVTRKIENLALRRKEDKLAGLEIADAIVTPIARKVLGKSSRIDFSILESKMRKNRLGDVTGYGLVILPKN